MTELELHQAVAAALADPDAWTQHAFARDRDGLSCSPTSPDAVRMCLVGHYLHLSESIRGNRLFSRAVARIYGETAALGYASMLDANDEGGYDVVRAMVASVIAACQRELSG
jgi:hypothetical protein